MPVRWLLVQRVAWKLCEAEWPAREGADRAGLSGGEGVRGMRSPGLWAPALPAQRLVSGV